MLHSFSKPVRNIFIEIIQSLSCHDDHINIIIALIFYFYLYIIVMVETKNISGMHLFSNLSNYGNIFLPWVRKTHF